MIEWMVSASALILAVLALRLALRRRMSPWLRYALWALVLARLLIPVSFGGSRISVLNAMPEQRASVGAPAQTVTDWTGVPAGQTAAAPDPAAGTAGLSAQTDAVGDARPAASGRRAGDTLSTAALLRRIWAAGALALAAVFLWANGRLARRLRKTRRPLEGTGAALPVYVSACSGDAVPVRAAAPGHLCDAGGGRRSGGAAPHGGP